MLMEIGGLLMTKPDYKNMTRSELKNYLLKHRNDEEGWSEFFKKLNQLDKSKTYPPIQKMNPKEVEAILQEKLG